jgi:predicted DsbA family dithiol-disulfide isomerase
MPEVVLFTDPACPFAFSAEPVRQRLRWHYGDELSWRTRLIVLTREPGEAEKLAQGAPGLQRTYGMPIDPAPRSRPACSEPACRAVVAVRLHSPEREGALLRRLQVLTMQGALLDDPAVISAAVTAVGLDPDTVARWSDSDAVIGALEDDVAAARRPAPAARALDHKLGGPAAERRYSAPSYVIADIAIPGFNPIETYETAIANVAPDLPRRPPPRSVSAVLEWAQEPLSTAEVALIMGTDIPRARADLARVGDFSPAGLDGYWTLRV